MNSKILIALACAGSSLMMVLKTATPENFSAAESRTYVSAKDTNSVLLQDISGVNLTLDDVKKKHSGKVIFIEYWASWCAPCRELMPASEKIRRDVSNLDVAYVYLSFDTDHAKWTKASGEEHIDKYALNYRITNMGKSAFMTKYELNFIPQAMILDKSGMVLNTKLTPGRETLVPYLTKLSGK